MKTHVKVPVVLQMENVECGAACLAMILAYHKKFVQLEKLRVDCGVARDGSNMKNISLAASYHGLKTKIYKANVNMLRSKIKYPAIIHWNFNHFVVLNGFNKDKALINDPAVGNIKIDAEEFEQSFTGIVMVFEKSEGFVADGKPRNATKFILNKLLNARALVIYIIMSGLLLALLNISTPLYSRIFIDYILFGHSPKWLTPLLITMALTTTSIFLLEFIKSYFLLKLQGKFSVSTSSMFMWQLLKLPMEFYNSRFIGDISEKQRSNDEVAKILCSEIIPVLLSCVMIIIYLIILFLFDVTMTLVGLLIAVLNIVVIAYNSKKNENSTRSSGRDEGRLVGFAITGIEMIETIKSSGAEQGYFEKLMGYATKYNNTQHEIYKNNSYFNIIPTILKEFLNIFILVLGVYYVLNGHFSVGVLLSCQGFMLAFLTPVNDLTSLSASIQKTKSQIERIDDVMNYSISDNEGIELTEYDNIEKLTGAVSIRNLKYSYNPIIAPLIIDFNLEIKKGEIVALVGGSGSGKSTIAKLIAGLLSPQDGEILFDGKPKSEIDKIIFTNSLATVDQQYTIFNDTVINNVTLWNDLISEQNVINACRDALLHDDITKRANGYENILISSGKSMSGGQCQRLDIARALVLNPTILILDEATSALDPTTEKKIMDNIKLRNITTIIIAHRLSTIRDADKIIFLKDGKITEQGTHDQLVSQDGLYAKLIGHGE